MNKSNLLCTKYEIKFLFSLIILTVISSVWEAFLVRNLITSLIVSSNETISIVKLQHPDFPMFALTEKMLGWISNVLIDVETEFWEQAIPCFVETFYKFGDLRFFHLLLTHFSLVSHFYTPWKRQKTKAFLTFSGGIEMWHWTKMG